MDCPPSSDYVQRGRVYSWHEQSTPAETWGNNNGHSPTKKRDSSIDLIRSKECTENARWSSCCCKSPPPRYFTVVLDHEHSDSRPHMPDGKHNDLCLAVHPLKFLMPISSQRFVVSAFLVVLSATIKISVDIEVDAVLSRLIWHVLDIGAQDRSQSVSGCDMN